MTTRRSATVGSDNRASTPRNSASRSATSDSSASRGSLSRDRAVSETAARLRLVIARLGRAVRQHAAAGLTPSQLSALATVEEHASVRMSDLATLESVGAPVATRVVDSLEKLGYVARIADPSDGRACLIELTDDGRSVLGELWSTRAAVLSARISRLPTDQVEVLAAALPVLEALVRDASGD